MKGFAVQFPVFATAMLLTLSGTSARAQQATTAVIGGFEVATVKPAQPGSSESRIGISDGSFVAINQSLRQIIKFAYSTIGSEDQLVGGPRWIDSAKFVVSAKEDETAAQQLNKLTRAEWNTAIQHQVQLLLADRFHLSVHRETRELPIYNLIVAPGGIKMKRDDGGPPGTARHSTGISGKGQGALEAIQCPTALLAKVLGLQPEVGHVVVDKTGLAGTYDFTLHWAPLLPDGTSPEDSVAPSLFTAVAEQLGLKLQKDKAPMDVFVIDHVDMPTGN